MGLPMWMMELRSENRKSELMRMKNKLKGRMKRIEDDKTWEESKVSWLLKERAWGERRNGNGLFTA